MGKAVPKTCEVAMVDPCPADDGCKATAAMVTTADLLMTEMVQIVSVILAVLRNMMLCCTH